MRLMGGRRNIALGALVLAFAVGGGGIAAPALAFETSSSKNFATPADVPSYFAGEGAPGYDRTPSASSGNAAVGAPVTAPIAAAPSPARPYRPAPAVKTAVAASPHYSRAAEARSRPVHHAANVFVSHGREPVKAHSGRSEPARVRHANSAGRAIAPGTRQRGAAVSRAKPRTAKFAQRHG